MTEPTGGFCLDCGHRVESFDGLDRCPACGSQSVPCANANQVDVSINWHELRVLVIWAENHQRDKQLGRTVYAIADRIAAQHPERAKACALSLAGELGQLAQQFPDISVNSAALRRDIAEQTGEETGLL